MLGAARPGPGRMALIGGLATASVGTLCLLLFFFKWRKNEQRRRGNQARSSSTTGTQVDALLEPALSTVTRAINEVINLDTRDPDVINSIDIFVDAGRALLESWRNRNSPIVIRNRSQRLALAGNSRDAASCQDSAVDLLADFDLRRRDGNHSNRDIDFELASNASSDVSFMSAVQELEELDRILLERFGSETAAYNDALKLAKSSLKDGDEKMIAYRTLRTAKVGCDSDEDFLAKLHLIRTGFEGYFSDLSHQHECSVLGREIFSKIISESGGDVLNFCSAFDELLRYCRDPDNLNQIKEELATRQVPHLGFYDVVLDFVLLDALDELEETPPSVHNALSSSWLPESLKKGALSAAITTAIRAKRSRMKYGDGFMSRYYALSDHLSIPLAWSILGPASPLQEKLASFQEMVAQFMREMFSPDFVSFTTPDETIRTLGALTDRYIGRLCLIFGVDKNSVLNL